MIFVDLILVVLLSPWLLICGLLSFAGWAFFSRSQDFLHQDVDEFDTVCKTLSQKKLISDQDYEFERRVVAHQYSPQTFAGYRLIMAPFIFLLKNSLFMNQLILLLAKKWIVHHKLKIERREKSSFQIEWAVLICTSIAHYLGALILFFFPGLEPSKVEVKK